MTIRYDFKGQTAVVTGGARGIGRAISRLLVDSSADVWIWDIDPVELPDVGDCARYQLKRQVKNG